MTTKITTNGITYPDTSTQVTSKPYRTNTVTTNGLSHYEVTGIPSWVKRITVSLNQVSTNGYQIPVFRLGYSNGGTYQSTGYVGGAIMNSSSNGTMSAITNSIPLTPTQYPAYLWTGHIVFTQNETNKWIVSGVAGEGTAQICNIYGWVNMLNTVDSIRISTYDGVDLFDGGSFTVFYE